MLSTGLDGGDIARIVMDVLLALTLIVISIIVIIILVIKCTRKKNKGRTAVAADLSDSQV